MEGECQFRASYDLLSFDFSASSQTSNNEAYIWPQAIRCGRVLSNEIKLDHGFHPRNRDGISRQAQMACVTATAPALLSLTPALRPVYNPHSSP
jgi:hypothetical protein